MPRNRMGIFDPFKSIWKHALAHETRKGLVSVKSWVKITQGKPCMSKKQLPQTGNSHLRIGKVMRCVLGIGLFVLLTPTPARAQLPVMDDASDYVSYRSSMEQRVFTLINQYRVAQHLPALVWNDELAQVARGESQDMSVGSADFTHTDFRGRMMKLKKGNWQSATENFLQAGQSHQVADVALQRWLADSRQVENVRGNWDCTGVGMWMNEQRAVFIVQIFARTSKSVVKVEPAPSVPVSESGSQYRGFVIDASGDHDAEGVVRIEQALKAQIDLVYLVGFPEEMLSFFQTVPLKIVSPWQGRAEVYSNLDKTVRVSNGLVALGHKPFLVSMLLSAFYDQKLAGSPREAPLETYYQQALHAGVYSLQSHMMSGSQGFFSATGTTFLYGVTAQEPFRRESIQTNLPGLIDYFKVLFGPKAGSYQGVLDR